MGERVRVRFAPSPTGDLHIGNARTALFNLLFARKHGGVFVLRIEDTDQERASKSLEENLLEDLRWLSLEWDEGPDKGGNYGPYRQSERIEVYNHYLRKLIECGSVYPCYCVEEELEEERRQLLLMKKAPRYGRRCLRLTEVERRRLENEGRRPAFRFHVQPGVIEFIDLVRGSMKFDAGDVGDFIIVRSNGIPSYNFAVVVDDHLMEITHVIRGEDHLSNTVPQIILYKALGFSPPLFAHHALILGKDRTKLSKRHGAVSVREFRSEGILPEALLNYLFLSGGLVSGQNEVVSLEEMIEAFSLERIGKSGAVFDEGKLRWLNALYIRKCDTARLSSLLRPFIRRAGYEPEKIDLLVLESIADALKDNLVTLVDVENYIGIFLDENFTISDECIPILTSDTALCILQSLHEALTNMHDFSSEAFYQDVIQFVRSRTGLNTKLILTTVRAAITGRCSGPELAKLFHILGRESLLRRIERVIERREIVGRS